MRHEQHRHLPLLAQPQQQIDDLRLHGHVERRRGLVGDQQLRTARERHGDHHALAHAAREFVRVGVDPLLGTRDAHLSQRLDRAPASLGLAHRLMREDLLHDLGPDAVHGVQRAHRILEHHGDALAADRAQFRIASGQ